MNAVENVAMPLMFRGDGKRDRTRKAVAMLKKVGLGNRMKHYPRQMSGGQQQRVGIASERLSAVSFGRRAYRKPRLKNDH